MIRVERYPLRRLFRRAPYATGYVIRVLGASWLYVRIEP